MTILSLLQQIFDTCIVPLLGLLTAYLVQLIKNKSEEAKAKTSSEITSKYINMVADTVSDCVKATNQTYVNSLKYENAFDKEAQQEAFKRTYDAVMSILTDEAKIYLSNIFGDISLYVNQKIEAEVTSNKIEIIEEQ